MLIHRTHPGWDIVERFRVPRRGCAEPAAAWGEAARLCLLVFRGGDELFGCPEGSAGRSLRAGALRFREGAEPAAGIAGDGAELEGGGGSAASLAAERVILGDMRS